MAAILWAFFLGLLLTLGGGVSRVDGAILFAGIILYTLFAIRLGRRERREMQERYAAHFGSRAGSIRGAALNCGLALGGLVMLVLGADRLVAGTVQLATWFGVSELVIGLTIVAAGTSVRSIRRTPFRFRRPGGGFDAGESSDQSTQSCARLGGFCCFLLIRAAGPGFADARRMILLDRSVLPFTGEDFEQGTLKRAEQQRDLDRDEDKVRQPIHQQVGDPIGCLACQTQLDQEEIEEDAGRQPIFHRRPLPDDENSDDKLESRQGQGKEDDLRHDDGSPEFTKSRDEGRIPEAAIDFRHGESKIDVGQPAKQIPGRDKDPDCILHSWRFRRLR